MCPLLLARVACRPTVLWYCECLPTARYAMRIAAANVTPCSVHAAGEVCTLLLRFAAPHCATQRVMLRSACGLVCQRLFPDCFCGTLRTDAPLLPVVAEPSDLCPRTPACSRAAFARAIPGDDVDDAHARCLGTSKRKKIPCRASAQYALLELPVAGCSAVRSAAAESSIALLRSARCCCDCLPPAAASVCQWALLLQRVQGLHPICTQLCPASVGCWGALRASAPTLPDGRRAW
jgi:hypothetical protein